MKVIPTGLREVVLLEPKIFEDSRGLTYESYNRRTFREATGVDVAFAQENREVFRIVFGHAAGYNDKHKNDRRVNPDRPALDTWHQDEILHLLRDEEE